MFFPFFWSRLKQYPDKHHYYHHNYYNSCVFESALMFVAVPCISVGMEIWIHDRECLNQHSMYYLLSLSFTTFTLYPSIYELASQSELGRITREWQELLSWQHGSMVLWTICYSFLSIYKCDFFPRFLAMKTLNIVITWLPQLHMIFTITSSFHIVYLCYPMKLQLVKNQNIEKLMHFHYWPWFFQANFFLPNVYSKATA
jgi:hypothetical protein